MMSTYLWWIFNTLLFATISENDDEVYTTTRGIEDFVSIMEDDDVSMTAEDDDVYTTVGDIQDFTVITTSASFH